jgi:Concanavalin A-like lectin/glucanases superfamily
MKTPRSATNSFRVRAILSCASLVVLAIALASCWLTESFGDLVDSGKGDAATDGRVFDDGALDGPHADSADAGRDTGGERDAAMPDASCTSSTSYRESVLAAKPLAYWRLDETKGSTAHDSSGNGHDATYSDSGVSYGQDGAIADDNDKSVLLDGKSGAILVAETDGGFDTTSEFAPNSPYSLEAWIAPMTIDSEYRGILSNELGIDGGKEGYVMYLHDSVGLGFDRYQTVTSTPLDEAGVVFPNKGFFHVVGTYEPGTSNGTMRLYVNGNQIAESSTSKLIEGGCTFAIGATHCGTTGFFEGYMDEVAVYDYALDSTCIQKHYALGIKK